MKKSCIILAAGDGKRMKSKHPKVLMNVLFEPMLGWVIDEAENFGFDKIGIIKGSGADEVSAYLEKRGGEFSSFLQTERKGTGHAVLQAMPLINETDGDILVLYGDAPFIDTKTMESSYNFHKENENDVTVITAVVENPKGYGRIVREKGKISAIVEQKDCTQNQAEIKEINSGFYWFNARALEKALPEISTNNASSEYYLTDAIEILKEKAGAFTAENPNIVLGANDRKSLLALNDFARKREIEKHLENGVEFTCVDGVSIGKDVEIGMDTVIYQGTIIKGKTKIGECGKIGPNTLIDNCTIGNNVILDNVQACESVVENNVKAGPYVQLRPKTHLKSGVKIGDFVEIKNSIIGEKTSIAHLTYIGDSDVGRGVNFGCGCVTANYDGISKFRTTIGDNSFIGCNTNLIAPVKVGNNATTGAGSTITIDVPDNSLAVERCDTKLIENWSKNFMRNKK